MFIMIPTKSFPCFEAIAIFFLVDIVRIAAVLIMQRREHT